MIMNFYQSDLRKMGQMMYEAVDLSGDDDFDMSGLDGFDDGLDAGMDSGMDDQGGMELEVMEIEPTAPVDTFSEEDNKVLKASLKKLAEYSSRLKDMDVSSFEPWMFAKITKAADYVDDVWHMLDVEVDFANTGFEQAGPEQDLNF